MTDISNAGICSSKSWQPGSVCSGMMSTQRGDSLRLGDVMLPPERIPVV